MGTRSRGPEPITSPADIAARYRAALEADLDAYLFLAPVRDADGAVCDFVYLDVSPAACRYTGIAAEELVGHRILELYPDLRGSELLGQYAAVVQTGEPVLLRKQLLDCVVQQGRRYFDMRMVPAGDGLVVVWRDVTDEVIEDSARHFMAYSAIGMAITSPEGRFQQVNRTMYDMLGYPDGALTGMSFVDLTHPEDVSAGLQALKEVMAGRTDPFHQRKRYRKADGQYLWAELSVSAIRKADGSLLHFVAQVVDVDAEVRSRELLDASARQYRMLAEHASDVVFQTDVAGDLQWISPSAARTLGWRPAEMLGTRIMDLVHPDDLPHLLQTRQRVLELGESGAAVGRYMRRDGQYRWMSLRAERIQADDGTVLGGVVSLRDVTQEQEAREELQRNREQYRMLAENSSDLVLQTDLTGTLTWVSPSVALILGLPPESVIGVPVAELVNPDDLAALTRAWQASRPDQPISTTIRLRVAEGTHRWYSARVHPIADGSGAGSYVCALRDVQAEMVARAAEQEAHTRLQQALDTVTDPFLIVSAVRTADGAITDFQFTDANRAARELFGWGSDLVGQRMFGRRTEAMNEPVAQDLVRVIRTGEPLHVLDWQLPDRMGAGDGYFDLRAVLFGDGLCLILRDVTERHEAARLLAASEARYRLLAENATDVVFQAHTNGQLRWLSGGAERLLGQRPAALVGRSLLDLVAEPDRPTMESALAGLANGEPQSIRLQMVRADGAPAWVEITAQPLANSSGPIVELVGGWRDVDAEVRGQLEMAHRARTDALTGLTNRGEALIRLEKLLGPSATSGQLAVLYCDVDEFKRVNDEYGHTVGDQLLREVARRLRRCVRETDLVARVGGDEMLVALIGVHDQAEAMRIAQDVRLAVSRPTVTDAGEVAATISVGVAISAPGDTIDALIARADTAMYRAKRGGRNGVGVPDASSRGR